MVGELNQEQIDQVLRTGVVGRIGCHAVGKTYIIPISYVYDGESIYAQSISGMKLQMMRLNPVVCFEVDHIKNAANWQSVIAWGVFEELKGEEVTKALRLLMQRMTALIADGQSVHSMMKTDAGGTRLMHEITMLYRIRLTEKTGRFEQDEVS
ncbi:MAG TPA: pyridoxamine 5'-phosphate oxidase family protein [Ktedonobacteraceae bacterium]